MKTSTRWRAALAAAALLLVSGCTAQPGPSELTPPERGFPSISQPLVRAMTADRVMEHMADLQEIADRNDATRVAGSPGHVAAVDHVSTILGELGFTVRTEPFTFTVGEVIRQTAEVTKGPKVDLSPYVMSGSAGTPGPVTGPLRQAQSSGCEPTDYPEAARAIVLVVRGACEFRVKAAAAAQAGAAAVLLYDVPTGSPAFVGAVTDPTGTVPIAVISEPEATALLDAMDEGEVELRVDLQTTSREVETMNVIADWPLTRPGAPLVMIGAHLDSVAAGPGSNDNASGVALVLALAETLVQHGNPAGLRIGLWSAEEFGLYGSIHHVSELDEAERSRITAYLNFDMVASPNGIIGLYGDRSLTQRFERAVADRGERSWPVDIHGASDHAPFERAGIPAGGIFTGAGEHLTGEQADPDGRAGGTVRLLLSPRLRHLPDRRHRSRTATS